MRWSILFAALLLAPALILGEASADERVETRKYRTPAPLGAVVRELCGQGLQGACFHSLVPGERLHVQIDDVSGKPVFAYLDWYAMDGRALPAPDHRVDCSEATLTVPDEAFFLVVSPSGIRSNCFLPPPASGLPFFATMGNVTLTHLD